MFSPRSPQGGPGGNIMEIKHKMIVADKLRGILWVKKWNQRSEIEFILFCFVVSGKYVI